MDTALHAVPAVTILLQEFRHGFYRPYIIIKIHELYNLPMIGFEGPADIVAVNSYKYLIGLLIFL